MDGRTGNPNGNEIAADLWNRDDFFVPDEETAPIVSTRIDRSHSIHAPFFPIARSDSASSPPFPPQESSDDPVFSAEIPAVPVDLPDVFSWNQVIEPVHVNSMTRLNAISAPPKILSLKIDSEKKGLRSIFIRDYYFAPDPEPPKFFDEATKKESEKTFPKPNNSPTPDSGHNVDFSAISRTRIRVPRDAIKLEDRLHYLLQPPIEFLLSSQSLELPFAPFAYQKQGIAFLYASHFAVLADEMGLGKTMQAITTIRLLLRAGEIRRVLLVCPKPLLSNWKREFELWAPEIAIEVIEGSRERRRWLWRLTDAPVRIANYELLQRDREFFEADETLLPRDRRPPFDLVVLDESQRIKNRSSVTFEAVSAIPRRRNWALTGTPVENSSEDLVSIFEFLAPGYLESGLAPRQMSEVVGEHILRRTKDKVLTDLPPKLFRDAHIDLGPEQAESYRMAKDEGELRLTELGDSVTMRHAFELILRLKQICNFDPASGESAKLERLTADLDEVARSGRKAIVFSQWVETLLRLKTALADFGPVEYHGRIPAGQRETAIARFRDDPKSHVILMSYGAGSVGLNLQFAGYVFLFDRWWNPAVEDQAINRAHRIGASGPVTVSRFVSVGTIEEKIDRILEEKRRLSETILAGARGLNQSLGLSQEDIFGLFNLKGGGQSRV